MRIGKRFPSARFTGLNKEKRFNSSQRTANKLTGFTTIVSSRLFLLGINLLKQQTRARKTTKKMESVDDLQGFDLLADAEQELVKRCFKGNKNLL